MESSEELLLRGSARLADGPAPGGVVVLHRVAGAESGPLDSAAAGPDGSFVLSLPRLPEAGEIFFATMTRDGIVYFGQPISRELPASYVIQTYPSAAAAQRAPPELISRTVIAEKEAEGWRLLDVFQLLNAHAATLISSEDGPAWSYRVPESATDLEVDPSSPIANAASISGGRIRLSAAVHPGEHAYAVRYFVPQDTFTLVVETSARRMDVLFPEELGEVEVTGLAQATATDMDGRTYRRFAGANVAPSQIRVGARPGPDLREAAPWAAAGVLLSLGCAGAVALARARLPRAGPRRAGAGAQFKRRRLLLEAARLDESRKRGEVDEQRYDKRRAELLARLRVLS